MSLGDPHAFVRFFPLIVAVACVVIEREEGHISVYIDCWQHATLPCDHLRVRS